MSTFAPEQDPFRNLVRGDDDPIGPFDADRICGAEIHTYPGRQHRVECLREPHPLDWVHVSCCDDQVDYVWREIWASPELQHLVITDEYVACRHCGIEWTTNGDHYADCPLEGGVSA